MAEIIAQRLKKAAEDYHGGRDSGITDAEYDALLEHLEDISPNHPLLKTVGAPIPSDSSKIKLPFAMASLNKIKPSKTGPTEIGDLEKWLVKFPAAKYVVQDKLDGISALYMSNKQRLFSRGDGVHGREITDRLPHLSIPTSKKEMVVRGELLLRRDAKCVKGSNPRNVVSGLFASTTIRPEPLKEVQFLAYEIVDPAGLPLATQIQLMKTAGFMVAPHIMLSKAEITEATMSEKFAERRAEVAYDIDGLVITPNIVLPNTTKAVDSVTALKNPTGKVAWKGLPNGSALAITEVTSVEWNTSKDGFLIPRVLFKPVLLGGVTITAATGLHARNILVHGIGAGAIITIRRAGDVIPQIVSVQKKVIPQFPSFTFEWIGSETDGLHIRAAVLDDSYHIVRLYTTLRELGVEGVAAGMVERLYKAGFNTLPKLYAATKSNLQRVDGVKERMAEKIWDTVQSALQNRNELNLLMASLTMPRGIGQSKLEVLLALVPDPAQWPNRLPTMQIHGLSTTTLNQIAASIPAYLAWRKEQVPWIKSSSAGASGTGISAAAVKTTNEGILRVCFTGVRNAEVEAGLKSKGHVVLASVNKNCTHLVVADDAAETESKTTKYQKALDLKIPIIRLEQLRKLLGL